MKHIRSAATALLVCIALAQLLAVPAVTVAQDSESVVDVRVTGFSGPTGVGLAEFVVESPVTVGRARMFTELVPEPPVMIARLASGETDIGMLPSNVAAQLSARGVPVQIAAASLWGVLYVVTRDADIDGWEDLRGQVFHSLAQGATPDVLSRHLMERSGVDPDRDVDMRYGFGHNELVGLLIAGEIETAVLPEPLVTIALAETDDLSIAIDLQAEWREAYGSRYPQTAIVVRSGFAEAHPGVVEDVLEAMSDAWDRVLASPMRASRLAAEAWLLIPPRVVGDALPRFNVDFQFADQARAELDRYFEILFEADPRNVGGRLPGDSLYWSP